MTLKVLLWDLKGIVLSPFKVTTENHSHTIRTGKSKVATTRSTTTNDLKPLSGHLKVTNVGVCVQHMQDRTIRGAWTEPSLV